MKNFAINAMALGVIAVMSVSQLAYAAETTENEKFNAVVNGTALENEVYETEDDVVMYPVREISEMLGYDLKWNEADNSCTVSDEDSSATFTVGKDTYTYGEGQTAQLGDAVELNDGLSYVPSSFLRGFFGLDVSEENNGTINITTRPEVMLEENNTVTVNKGELFGVRLESNPSTGYSWSVEKSDDIVLLNTIVDQAMNDEAPAGTNAVGAPAMNTWLYKCDVPGEYTLKYTYARSFEEKSTAQTAEFKVVVTDGNTETVTTESKELEAKKGDNFTITLEENASTGYVWTVEKEDKIELVETVEAQAENTENTEDKVGVPASKTWTFKCDEAGEYKIKFTCARSGEGETPVKVVEYTVTVK